MVYYGTSSQVNGIAYDWISGNLYWTDAMYNMIMMAKVGQKGSVKWGGDIKTGWILGPLKRGSVSVSRLNILQFRVST